MTDVLRSEAELLHAMIEAVVEVLFEGICSVTGYCILKVITLGRWQPVAGHEHLSVVGLVFWLIVIGVVAGVFLL